MSKLKKYKLGDITQIIGGGTPPTTDEESWNGEISWLTPRDLTGYSFRYISKGERNITLKGLKNSSVRLMPKGTVLLTSRAPIGYLAIAGDQLCTNQGFKSFITDEDKIHNEYLYYLLKSKIDRIKSLGTGSTFAEVSASILKNFEIEIPNIQTQKEIATILSSLDDKIELNLQMNQTLEAMAQAIFKEWFVHFNFPGFDGELVDGLPKGWRLGILGELLEKLSKGTTPTQKDLGSLEVQIPFLKVKDISDNGTILKSNLELIPIEVHQNQLKRSVLKTDDILFSIAGTIGRVAILDKTLNNSNCNQAIAFIRLTEKSKYLEYVHQWLKSETVQNNIKSSIVQGVQANVSLTVLSNIDIVIPDDTTIEHWNSLIKPTYSRLLTNTYQIENLTQTRDTLLPKLMSGQLEVAE